MGRKIFVSYKYSDESVERLSRVEFWENTKVRDYVDELQDILDNDDNINTGEKDGESLEEFKDEHIRTELKKRIFQSSITIIMISQQMHDNSKYERDQWIPWEISYSLRTIARANSISRANAVLGIVLPDINGSYEWYYSNNEACKCTTHRTDRLFNILSSNMFNQKKPSVTNCEGTSVYHGEFSYIKTITWTEFKIIPNFYLDKAIEIRDNKESYNLTININ